MADQPITPLIGATKLRELSADDVDDWLRPLSMLQEGQQVARHRP
jgi:hypothetical protein